MGSCFLEAILTFFLISGILFISTNKSITIMSGLAIGLIIVFATIVGLDLTGASMNPARSFGPGLFSGNLPTYWIYVLGPFIGGIVAILTYQLYT